MQLVEDHGDTLADALAFLSTVAIFRDVPEKDLRQLMEIATAEVYSAGDVILMEGEATNDLLIVGDGTVEVYVARDDKKISITELGAGSYFGEMSIFDDYPRSANVRAVTDVVTYCIDRRSFKDFLKANPAVLFQICTVFSHRLRKTNSALAKH